MLPVLHGHRRDFFRACFAARCASRLVFFGLPGVPLRACRSRGCAVGTAVMKVIRMGSCGVILIIAGPIIVYHWRAARRRRRTQERCPRSSSGLPA